MNDTGARWVVLGREQEVLIGLLITDRTASALSVIKRPSQHI